MPRRLFLASACLLFLAFAMYGSFVPFRVEPIAFSEALARFLAMGRAARIPSRIGTDFVANVLLFVPIGFTLAGAIANRSRLLAWAVAVPVAAVLGFAASVAIEFGQIFVTRTPSAADVMAQTLGSVTGAIAWAVAGAASLDWLRPLRARSAPRIRAVRLLGLYASVWLLLQVLPLDITLDPGAVGRKLREGRIILQPFGGDPTLFDAVVAFGTAALQALPLGALWVLIRDRVEFSRGSLTRIQPDPLITSALLASLLTVLALELAQVLVYSRSADVTDVLAGGVGAAVGVWLAILWLKAIEDRGDAHAGVIEPGARPPDRVRPWALIVLALWLGVLVIRHWTPFEFTFTRALYDDRVRHLYEVPFRHYYWSNYLGALSEAWTKILLGVPVGLLLQVFWPPRRDGMRHVQMAVVVLCAAVLFLGVELGQVFLPTRVPDVTDAILGTLGAVAGAIAVRLVASGHGER